MTPTNDLQEKPFDTKKTESKLAPAKEPEKKVDTKTKTEPPKTEPEKKPDLKKPEPQTKPDLKKPEPPKPEPEKRPELKTRADLEKKVTDAKKPEPKVSEPEKPKKPIDKKPVLKTPEIIVPEDAERPPAKVDIDFTFNHIIKRLRKVFKLTILCLTLAQIRSFEICRRQGRCRTTRQGTTITRGKLPYW